MVINVIVAQLVHKNKDGDGKKIEISVVNNVDVILETSRIFMAKMRLFKFWNADGVEKEKERRDKFKKAMSVQSILKIK